jgi:hypothetical protein
MLYAIAGNGTGPVKEITAALKDLRDKATQEDVDFWTIMEGKDEPTATDNAIVKWLTANEIWFEIYTATGTTVDGAQETIATDDVFGSMLERIQERVAESEDATLLVLLDDDNPDDDLQRFMETAIDGDTPVFQLNGQMYKITLEGEDEGEVEPEPEPVPAKSATKKAAAAKAPGPVKKAAKKAAASATVDEIIEAVEELEEGEPEADEVVVYTPAELAKMTMAELGAVARSQGIDSKGASKKELIEVIESKLRPPETVALTNGDGQGVLVVVHFNHAVVTRMIPEADALAFIAQ